MSEVKSRQIRTISWQDEAFQIIMQWIGNRILDFFWKKIKANLKFEGQTHLRRQVFKMFGIEVLMFMFGYLLYVPDEQSTTEYRILLGRFLKLHRKYHQVAGNQICCVCLNIALYKPHFEKYVSDTKLYPPLKFQVLWN